MLSQFFDVFDFSEEGLKFFIELSSEIEGVLRSESVFEFSLDVSGQVGAFA